MVDFTKTLELPSMDLTPGTMIAERYQIIEELGRGGMGKVFRVEDTNIQEEVALKLIKPEIAVDEIMIERFRNELKIARKITHKNVCRMYDLNQTGGMPFITMEYVKGEDLKTLIKRDGSLSPNRTLLIARQVCQGLAEAHEQNVIHRDLKPQNIMIHGKDGAKIMDFGISRFAEKSGVTQTGTIIGTPDYMSPEQADGAETDQRSDIYSLGVIFYEMLTGKVPFEGSSALSVALKHKTERPKNPVKLNPDISEDLSQMILKCLQKEKEKRYQTVKELLSDIDLIDKGQSIAAVEGGWENSIAVLPFMDMSAQKDQEYFCDGLSEDLINALTQIKSLRVVARTSAFSFKGKNLNIHEIGEKLNVDTVLEGSVRRAGNRLRITAQLINVADGYHLWSERFNRELTDIFDIQDDITLNIVKNLKVEFLGEEKSPEAKSRTENPLSYEAYLKGRFHLHKLSPEHLDTALEYFQISLDEDPEFALPYAGIAFTWLVRSLIGIVSPIEAFPKIEENTLKALELDESLAEAHEIMADIKIHTEKDWKLAEDEFRRAIECNANAMSPHLFYGNFLDAMGRHEEAGHEIQKAMDLDPLNAISQAVMGGHFLFMGRYDEAIAQYKKTLKLEPNFSMVHNGLWATYHMKGMEEEALAEAKKYFTALDDNQAVQIMDLASIESGYRDAMRRLADMLAERSQSTYVQPTRVADLYVYAGDKQRALDWLEKAHEQNAPSLLYINIQPEYYVLKDDPRFQSILKQMNFLE